jgi:hypothetical protein
LNTQLFPISDFWPISEFTLGKPFLAKPITLAIITNYAEALTIFVPENKK